MIGMKKNLKSILLRFCWILWISINRRIVHFLNVSYALSMRAGRSYGALLIFWWLPGNNLQKSHFSFGIEYKKQADTSNDPLGQLLAGMVAAQTMNPHSHPIYGVYIIRRHWYFVLLDGKIYAESLAYDATKDDIMTIVAILRRTKEIIDHLVQSFPQSAGGLCDF